MHRHNFFSTSTTSPPNAMIQTPQNLVVGSSIHIKRISRISRHIIYPKNKNFI